jgi:hypothetical protein
MTATNIQPGQLWLSPDTGNRWRVLSVDGDMVGVRRINLTDPADNYCWHPGAFSGMRLLDTRPCPACGAEHDPTFIPPPRVPLDVRCACCCQ